MEKKAIAVKQRPPKRPHLRMNLVLNTNALGLAIGKYVHLILHRKRPKAPAVFFSRHRLDHAALGAGGTAAWDQLIRIARFNDSVRR